MSNQTEPGLAKWPFFLGDAVLLVVAGFICAQNKLPLGHWELACLLVSGAAGAGLAVVPFVLEYRAAIRLGETSALTSTVAQIQNLDLLAVQISAATAQWQIVQEQSSKTVGAAREIAERMTAETAAFSEFLQKANDGEKANLRLEVEKLRRVENDWLQIIVRMLDHTYALHQAALRSGQPGLIEQLGHFQNACRDVARRIGLVPFAPAVDELYDPQCHQLADAEAGCGPGAQVGDTLATGYTYQGRMLRPALVALQSAVNGKPAAPEINHKASKEMLQEETLL